MWYPSSSARSPLEASVGPVHVFPPSTERRITEDGQERVLTTAHDITATVEADRRVQRNDQVIRSLLENFPMILYRWDPDGTITESTGSALERLRARPTLSVCS